MTRIELPALVDLPAALTLADALRAAPGTIEIGAAAVERIGVSGLQLLLSVAATAKATKQGFAIDRPSAAFTAAARTVGAGALLTLDR